jgi:hypothetical protein
VKSKEEVLVKEERCLEAIPVAIPPQIFLRWLATDHVLCFSCYSPTSFHERLEDPLYNCFYVKTKRTTWNEWYRRLEAQTRHGGAVWIADYATWSHLRHVYLLVAHFISYKISKTCSLTLPFFESHSFWKVKNAKKKVFSGKES